MDADRGIDALVLLGQLDGAIERSGARPIAIADGQHGGHAGRFRARKDVGTVAVEALVLGMAVRVGVHDDGSVETDCYFSRAQSGTSSRNPASTGTPSSPSEAATIMPCDSSPRSLRGARLATITTLRPMSFSGS